MIDKSTKNKLNEIGEKLALTLPDFYGRICFNIFNGSYVNSNVEQSIKPDNLKKGAGSGSKSIQI